MTRAFKCAARASIDPPQDCDWPLCSCDPYANKVCEALHECGAMPPTEEMITAGVAAVDEFYSGGKSDDMRGAVRACYLAMVATLKRMAGG